MRVEESIQRRFRDTGTAVFVPEQFIDEGLGDASVVLTALRSLEEDGYLRAWAGLRCAFNHEFWGGRPDEVPPDPILRCTVPDCPSHTFDDDEREDEDAQPYVLLRYHISRAWMNQLGRNGEAGEKKKRTRPRSDN